MSTPSIDPNLAAWLAQRLSKPERALLSRRGFVSSERLASGSICCKLRFRDLHQRQRVVYIGTNQQLAAALRAELHRLQSTRRERRARRRLVRRARRLLRTTKEQLQRDVSRRGFEFHGYALRRRRPRRKDPQASTLEE